MVLLAANWINDDLLKLSSDPSAVVDLTTAKSFSNDYKNLCADITNFYNKSLYEINQNYIYNNTNYLSPEFRLLKYVYLFLFYVYLLNICTLFVPQYALKRKFVPQSIFKGLISIHRILKAQQKATSYVF